MAQQTSVNPATDLDTRIKAYGSMDLTICVHAMLPHRVAAYRELERAHIPACFLRTSRSGDGIER